MISCDLLVVGGGYAGMCAAIAAGRQGLKVVLIEKEMYLGGNGGPNLGVGSTGTMLCNPYYNEGGIIEEMEEEVNWNRARTLPTNFGYNINPAWDTVVSGMLDEAGVIVFRKHLLFESHVENDVIKSVSVLNIEDLSRFEIAVKGFCVDASGDAHLAALSCAECVMGREGRDETGERCAPEQADQLVSTASITALVVDTGVPSEFLPPTDTPEWNPQKPDNHFDPAKKIHFIWQVDEGGENDENHPLYTPQELYTNLRKRIYSVWNYLKNIKYKDECRNHQLIWISPILGKRESRRIVGDYLLTQTDIEACTPFEDRIAFAGAYLDEHMPSFDGGYEVRYYVKPLPYDIPFRCLYSKNISNLFAAGRNIGVSHLAFTSTRLMRTCGVLGQVTGIAAALCMKLSCTPRELAQQHISLLQEEICRQGMLLLGDEKKLNYEIADASEDIALSRNPVNGKYVPADRTGVLLYHYNTHVEKVSFYVKNEGPETTVTGFLGYGETEPIKVYEVPEFIYDYEQRKYIKKDGDNAARGKINVVEGNMNPTGSAGFDEFYQRDDKIRSYKVIAQQQKIIPAHFEGFVEFELYNEIPFKAFDRSIIGQAVVLGIEGDVELLTAPHPVDVVECLRNGVTDPVNIPVFKIYPEVHPGSILNLLNGKSARQGKAFPNAWIANAGAFVELKCNKEIESVIVKFDKVEKFWTDTYLAKNQRVAGRLVREYRLEGFDGQWRELAHVTDNYHERNELHFDKNYYNKIRLTIIKVWDENQPARVTEIRL